MNKDIQFENYKVARREINHLYGDKVHILQDLYALTLLAKLAHPSTLQPHVNFYVEKLYEILMREVINHELPTKIVSMDTRMKALVPQGIYNGPIIDELSNVISVGIARAGTWPSHVCFDRLNHFIEPEHVRQDHFFMNRKVNENGEVVGVDVSGSKIGGTQENAVVLLPDPMGATGGSLSYVIDHYKKNVTGTARKYVVLHLIVTPEYIARMTQDHPDVEIYALRLDRGLSKSDVFMKVPGEDKAGERGLTDSQYIVPGAGGVGEILNNTKE